MRQTLAVQARRVVVTGMGLVTPVGVGLEVPFNNLLKGKSGVVSTVNVLGEEAKAVSSQVAAFVPLGPESEGKFDENEWLAAGEARKVARFTQFAIAATELALRDAGWRPSTQEEKDDAGICIGSGIGSFDDYLAMAKQYFAGKSNRISPLFMPRSLINMAAGNISIKYGLRGPLHSVSTACATGLHAIGDASRFIKHGDADVMIAGGSEASVNAASLASFARARSLSTKSNDDPAHASRPFDKKRDGFVMGEGAGIVILEELEHAKARNAKIYAEVRGYGLSGDAHHFTAPPEDGSGALLAMKRALRDAQIEPSQVDYINAHATSTALGDAAENRAIKSLLLDGPNGKKSANEINISSSKGAIGHLLGAAGSVEAIFAIMALHKGILPPTTNLEDPGDPTTGSTDEYNCNYIIGAPQEAPNAKVALTNSFGFGGVNTSVCLARLD